MKRSWPWFLLILVSLELVFGWPRQEPTEEQLAALREERRLEERAKQWREDFRACDRFASRRDDARKLLALDPEAESKKSFEQKAAESLRALENIDVSQKEMMRRWEADRRACLRGEGWKDEQIDELEAKDREERNNKATGNKKALPRSTTR